MDISQKKFHGWDDNAWHQVKIIASIGYILAYPRAQYIEDIGKDQKPLTALDIELALMKKEVVEMEMEQNILKSYYVLCCSHEYQGLLKHLGLYLPLVAMPKTTMPGW